jgi:hypothetical protein
VEWDVPVTVRDGTKLPCPHTLKAKLVVIGERAENIGGKELRCDLTDHGASVRQP